MRHLIFDTETTNLIHNSLQPLDKQPRIIEFFGMVLDDTDWSEISILHKFFNPGIVISEEVVKITGVTNARLAHEPSFSKEASLIKAFINSAHVVVAHNLSYDKSVIDFELRRLGESLEWPAGICTVEATEHLKGYRLSLTNLHTELFGVPFEKAHSAEHDVRALARCYIELVKRGEI